MCPRKGDETRDEQTARGGKARSENICKGVTWWQKAQGAYKCELARSAEVSSPTPRARGGPIPRLPKRRVHDVLQDYSLEVTPCFHAVCSHVKPMLPRAAWSKCNDTLPFAE